MSLDGMEGEGRANWRLGVAEIDGASLIVNELWRLLLPAVGESLRVQLPSTPEYLNA